VSIEFSHRDVIPALRTHGLSEALRTRVTELFLVALATGWHRGLTPLAAYYAVVNIPDHAWAAFEFDPKKRYYEPDRVPCAVCGLTGTEVLHSQAVLNDFKIGRCSLQPSYSHLLDLDDVANLTVEYRPEYVAVLKTLLQAVDASPAGELPSELQ
jgi:hypothetical protein